MTFKTRKNHIQLILFDRRSNANHYKTILHLTKCFGWHLDIAGWSGILKYTENSTNQGLMLPLSFPKVYFDSSNKKYKMKKNVV